MNVAEELYELNMLEFAAAVGLSGASRQRRRLLLAPLAPMARALARHLAEFDAAVGRQPLHVAARALLRRFGAAPTITGAVPTTGPLLVISNHPGVYDAISTFVAIARDDVRVIVAERPFLRALPRLQEHFVFVPELASGADRPLAAVRALGLRRAIRHLRSGGALLHYAAGAIEPDPDFLRPSEEPLLPWHVGTGTLVTAAARLDAPVVVAMVSGVHSARAKRSWVVRAAERRGITTLAGLLQVAVPGFREVELRVRLSEPRRAREAFAGLDEAESIAALQRIARALIARRGA